MKAGSGDKIKQLEIDREKQELIFVEYMSAEDKSLAAFEKQTGMLSDSQMNYRELYTVDGKNFSATPRRSQDQQSADECDYWWVSKIRFQESGHGRLLAGP